MSDESAKIGAGKDPGNTTCVMKEEVDALIIFPTLGVPQIMKSPLECTIIVVTDSTGRSSLLDPQKGPVLVNHHLRLIELDDDKTKLPLPIDHRFYKQIEDSLYATNKQKQIDEAKNYITIELLEMRGNTLYMAKKGEKVKTAIGCLSSEAYSLYTSAGCTSFLAITLKRLYESAYKLNSTPKSWAWIVRTNFGKTHKFLNPKKTKVDQDTQKPTNEPEEYKEGDANIPKVHQPLDRIIHNELIRLASVRPSTGGMMNAEDLFEVPVETGDYGAPDKNTGYRRVQAWHPVMTKDSFPLKLGHLTDFHISVRAATIAKSPVRIIEDAKAQGPHFEPVGQRLAHTFKSFKALVDTTKQKGADALAITGDTIDFNRNIDPMKTKDMSKIEDVWGTLNVIGHVHIRGKNSLYKRGIDQLYFYSTVLYALRKYQMPSYCITGNHEGYQWPYGISPRLEGDTNKETANTAAGSLTGMGSSYTGLMDDKTGKEEKAAKAVRKADEHLQEMKRAAIKKNKDPDTDYSVIAAKKKLEDAKSAHEKVMDSIESFHLKQVERASRYHQKKANPGIPADHNLTIFEACLAYGPTYGQTLTSNNLRREQNDWFHWLYAPFSDLNVYPGTTGVIGGAWGSQTITLLGWGASERILAPGAGGAAIVSGNTKGEDRRGKGFLPYAPNSISKEQLKIIKAASEAKAGKWVVLSHFNVASYNNAVPANAPQDCTGFQPSNKEETDILVPTIGDTNAQYNFFNWGGCEIGLKKYIEDYTAFSGTVPVPGKVYLHLSGHSHRLGIYTLSKDFNFFTRNGVSIECGVPKIPKAGFLPGEGKGTRYIVGNTGGPIGTQTLAGWSGKGWTDNKPDSKNNWNSFLGGWLLRPPSGLVVDGKTGASTYVMAAKADTHDLPRLSVMLDYRDRMCVAEGPPEYRPFVVCPKGESYHLVDFFKGLPVKLSKEIQEMNCLNLSAIKVWMYRKGAAKEKPVDGGQGAAAGSSDTASSWQNGWKSFDAYVTKKSAPDHHDGDHKLLFNDPAGASKVFPLESGYEHVPMAFMEIKLQKPTSCPGVPWEEVNWDESWVFPVSIVRKGNPSDWKKTDTVVIYRDDMESGEVPNWSFLEKYGEGKYPSRKSVVLLNAPTSDAKKS